MITIDRAVGDIDQASINEYYDVKVDGNTFDRYCDNDDPCTACGPNTRTFTVPKSYVADGILNFQFDAGSGVDYDACTTDSTPAFLCVDYTITLIDCIEDADCGPDGLGITCEPPLGTYPERYAGCNVGTNICDVCGACGVNTDCTPNFCCEGEISRDIDGDSLFESCVDLASIGQPYICDQ